MRNKNVLTYEDAKVIVDAIIKKATDDKGKPLGIAITDDTANLITLVRMTGAKVISGESAMRKAHTSVYCGTDTRGWMDRRRQDPWGNFEPIPAGCTVLPGGVAIIEPGESVPCGGIGIAGRTPDEDEAFAYVGLEALQNILWPSK